MKRTYLLLYKSMRLKLAEKWAFQVAFLNNIKGNYSHRYNFLPKTFFRFMKF